MATLKERNYISTFAGLKGTAITAGSFLVVGFAMNEVLKRLRRYPDEDRRRAKGEKVRDRGVEAYAMGYVYRARSFVPHLPTPDFGPRPLAWIYSTSYKLPEKFYEVHCGADATTYLRFLRGTFYWTLLLTCTIFPLLLSIHFIESDATVSTASIDRASLTSLVLKPNGTRLLWVHVICIWLMTFSWYAVLGWIGYGTVRIRRNNLRRLLRDEADFLAKGNTGSAFAGSEPRPMNPDDERPVGWRWRTILMRNIPPAMRSDEAIREYFESALRYGGEPSSSDVDKLECKEAEAIEMKSSRRALPPTSPRSSSSAHPRLISDIILVRKQNELNELYVKLRAVQHELESAHTELAQNVMKFVTAKVEEQRRRDEGLPIKKSFWRRLFKQKKATVDEDLESVARQGDHKIIDALRKFLVDPDQPLDYGEPGAFWIALNALHSSDITLLDRFQPLVQLKHFYNGQKVPSIDYHLAKMNLLTRLIEEIRANPEQIEIASSALITFESATDARRARKELKPRMHGRHRFGQQALACKIEIAPEKRDLDWNKLVNISLSGDILRGFLLQTAIWAATIIWVIPVSFVVGLLSLSSISKYIPKLAKVLEDNTVTQSLFQSLLPTSIVALLGMLVPTLIGIITRNGQALITTTRVHSAVQARYWKWSMTNIILLFCIGLTAFNAFLNAFKQPTSVLTVVASSFPKGATFFVSWTLLVVGVHHGIEIALFGIPWINHASIRKYKAPRKRALENEPRFFNYAYWMPNHLIVFAVTAIFACLNPLVIAFNMFYQLFEMIVFKSQVSDHRLGRIIPTIYTELIADPLSQVSHVYWRRWYENGGRYIYRRLFRYSLDVFLVAQTIIMAFMFVTRKPKYGGAVIPLLPVTVIVKLIGTRWFDALLDEIDEAEIDIVCCDDAQIIEDLSVPLTDFDHNMHNLSLGEAYGTIKTFTTSTLPALALRPHEKLPIIPSPAKSAEHLHSRAGSTSTAQSPTAGHTSHRHHHLRHSLDDNVPLTQVETLRTPTPTTADLTVTDVFGPKSSPPSSRDTFDLKQFAQGDHGSTAPKPAFVDETKLIALHPPLTRDDRPVTNVRYDNPAQVAPLDRSLWLPSNPLIPVDLGDTIDYYGRAMVSSEGGDGMIGRWDDDEYLSDETAIVAADGQAVTTPGGEGNGFLSVLKRSSSRTSGSTKSRPVLSGNERIRVASDVALRIEAEGTSISVVSDERPRNSSIGSASGSMMPSMRRNSLSEASQIQIVTSPSPVGTSPTEEFDQGSPGPRQGSSPSMLHSPASNLSSASPVTPLQDDAQVQEDGTHLTLTPRRPSNLNLGDSAAFRVRDRSNSGHSGPRTPRYASRTRNARSPSVAPSGISIAEEEEGHSGVVVISQSVALIGEVLEEERKEHEERKEKEQKRHAQESQDRKLGWFSKLLLKYGGDEHEAEST
ncbi:BZ3500_MvSof-1268-A1-R1_Chr7-1g09128 [Microbotryum saponariae]|uniref:BZ3500_MvSof-1268-A1-R1_Chr7-1g09128 protein n=1 Tax=Microbotryum saponariae TaxID=289078 RepID=A0A2X0KWG0_9BASI|nr:BZ3501_MvSof-1269-A2-R1_Chr7-1g08833 [Microbotryum saponariae]SDA02856.1 BZ3500_MvSof-1268-A1-R1_Chr7-1g09128 [Microbotryum saponariae]